MTIEFDGFRAEPAVEGPRMRPSVQLACLVRIKEQPNTRFSINQGGDIFFEGSLLQGHEVEDANQLSTAFATRYTAMLFNFLILALLPLAWALKFDIQYAPPSSISQHV